MAKIDLPAPPQGIEATYYIELCLVDRMPKSLRDALNYAPAGTHAHTTIQIWEVWQDSGLQKALEYVSNINETARRYYRSKGLEPHDMRQDHGKNG